MNRGRERSRKTLTAVVLGSIVMLSCRGRGKSEVGAQEAVGGHTDGGIPVRAYPPGRWRLAPFSEVNQSVVWISHIVIMHRESDPMLSLLWPDGWTPHPIPKRSVKDAWQTAQKIRERVRTSPRDFDQIARATSDDLVTGDQGGSLGGVAAGQLPPQILDALATMTPGDVSEVIGTAMGFHIVLKRAPPPPVKVAGLRLAVRYATTVGEQPSEVTKEAALEVARALVARARAGEDFSSLVDVYSGHPDRIRHGDLGTRLSTEPGSDGPIIEALARLAIGEVSEPIDSRWGFQIVKRFNAVDRQKFASRALYLSFDPKAPEGSERSEGVVKDQAKSIANALPNLIEPFTKGLREHCCAGVQTWTDGTGDPELTNTLDQMQIGQFSSTPIKLSYSRYAILQRVDPDLVVVPHETRHELPTPESVDLESLIGNSTGDLAPQLTQLGAAVSGSEFNVTPAERAVVQSALKKLMGDLGKQSDSESRVAAYRNALGSIYAHLPEAAYAQVIVALQQWIAAILINGSPP